MANLHNPMNTYENFPVHHCHVHTDRILEDYGITAELTSTRRVGMHRHTRYTEIDKL